MSPTELMQTAVQIAIDGLAAGRGGPFGAVVVKAGEIVGRGCNCVTSTNDPTAHAEVTAIRDACRRLGTFSLTGCEIYASCEPCPLCLAAIYWARLDRLTYSANGSDAAAVGFSDEDIRHELQLPPASRRLETRQLLLSEALSPFALWRQKTDRTPY